MVGFLVLRAVRSCPDSVSDRHLFQASAASFLTGYSVWNITSENGDVFLFILD